MKNGRCVITTTGIPRLTGAPPRTSAAAPRGALVVAGGIVTRAACCYGTAPCSHFSLILRAIAGVVRHSAFMVSRTGGVFVLAGRVAAACTRRAPAFRRARVTLTNPRDFLEVKLAGHLAVACPGSGAAHRWIVRIVSPGGDRHYRGGNGRADKRVDPHLLCSLPIAETPNIKAIYKSENRFRHSSRPLLASDETAPQMR